MKHIMIYIILVAIIVVFAMIIILLPHASNYKQINSLKKINLGGVSQWIDIRGNDISKPVLLFLHGGPGYVIMPLLHNHNRQLEHHFIVVNWDQRGAGLSFSEDIPIETMTLKQLLSDVHELTNLLKSRFNKDKIYIAGHSFGTILGLMAIDKYPEDYIGYISIGQVVNFVENEQMSYDFAYQMAREDENEEAIGELDMIGRPNVANEYLSELGYEITSKWVEYYGGDLYGKSDTSEIEDEILTSKIYNKYSEKVELGWEFSSSIFQDPAIKKIDFKKSIKKVKVPIYFFIGRHDYDTPFKLVEEYYNIIDAPKKEIVWFENSAHFPFYEEPDKFNFVAIRLSRWG